METTLAFKIFKHITQSARDIFSYAWQCAGGIFVIVKDHRIDKTLNIQTSEPYFKDRLGLYKDGCPYQPTPYYVLEAVVDYLRPKPEDVFIDFGSGRGRVVIYIALQRLKKVIGVEIDKELTDDARRNIENSKSMNRTPIKLVNTDAAAFNITDENIFFMFNPFGYKTFQAVISNIKNSLFVNPRHIRIIYWRPTFRSVLADQDWLFLEKKIDNGNCCIWSSKKVDTFLKT